MVKSELEKVGLHPVFIEMGEITIKEDSIDKVKAELIKNLESMGLELMDDKRSQTIEKIKTLILEVLNQPEAFLKINLSNYLSENLNQNSHYLSNLFTDANGITIEHYFITQKIEHAKELLIYNEHSLSEIAYQLNYSSVAHLRKQFKKLQD